MANSIYVTLLYGGIRKNMGNGLPFYAALSKASAEDLSRAQAKLEADRFCIRYAYRDSRLKSVKRKIAELAAAAPHNVQEGEAAGDGIHAI